MERPRITRAEARLIAEELHKLMKQDAQPEPPEELMTMREAAAYTRRSYSFFQHEGGKIPRVKNGGRYYYTKASLAQHILRS